MHSLSKSLIASLGAVVAACCAFSTMDARSTAGFGEDARRLDADEMATTTGGVIATVLSPAPTTAHHLHNPQLRVDVTNYQSQSTTDLYLYHGTVKTGSRQVATPAPSYAGLLETRFTLGSGVEDLVIKYRNSAGNEMVAGEVENQVLHPDVKLFKVVVHNLTTNSNATNVARDIILRAIDGQTYGQALSVSDSADTLFATCPDSKRIQLMLGGLDGGGQLDRVTLHSNDCSDLSGIKFQGNQILDRATRDCVQVLGAARDAVDPTKANVHIFVIKTLGVSGFYDDVNDVAIIGEAEFAEDPWKVASLIAHEVSHAFGLSHVPPSSADCSSISPHHRRVMCDGGTIGKLFKDTPGGECDLLYLNAAGLFDYNP